MGYFEVGKQIKTRWFLLRGLDSKILDEGNLDSANLYHL